VSIKISCLLKKLVLPCFPCSCRECDWFVHENEFNNCFWVIMHLLSKYHYTFSFEEIAKLEDISIEEVEEIYNTACIKLKNEFRKYQENNN
jgi:hypothetical protein